MHMGASPMQVCGLVAFTSYMSLLYICEAEV